MRLPPIARRRASRLAVVTAAGNHIGYAPHSDGTVANSASEGFPPRSIAEHDLPRRNRDIRVLRIVFVFIVWGLRSFRRLPVSLRQGRIVEMVIMQMRCCSSVAYGAFVRLHIHRNLRVTGHRPPAYSPDSLSDICSSLRMSRSSSNFRQQCRSSHWREYCPHHG